MENSTRIVILEYETLIWRLIPLQGMTNLVIGLTLMAYVLCVCFAAYLNGVDTLNIFGASTMIVKIRKHWSSSGKT